MHCWKLKVKEVEHGEDQPITRYYKTRGLAVRHGFELVKKVLLEEACWDQLLEADQLTQAMKEAEEAFYLTTSSYDEITKIEQRSNEYRFLSDNNISITLKLIPVIDTETNTKTNNNYNNL